MKNIQLLVIGIDAADYRIINHMPMPFMQRLIGSSIQTSCKEDLLSRGWAEIYTGRHASETCAFYDRPSLDGTVAVTQNFTTAILDENIVTIWKKLNQLGKRVGIINIPTTYPAESVDGFMIGGGGGGLNRLKKIDDVLCYPADLAAILKRNRYVPDLRLTTSSITDTEHFFNSYKEMVERRIRTYIESIKNDAKGIDFGFIVFRALAIIQYLGMAEFEYMIDSPNKPIGLPGDASNTFRNLMTDFYSFFDGQMKHMMSELNPSHFIFVSDHGQVPYLNNMNCNAFLAENEYLTKKSKSKSASENIIKKVLPQFVKSRLAERMKNVSRFMVDFEAETSTAFSLGLINGIYINDSRFYGKVSNSDRPSLVQQICKALNNDARSQAFGMHAIPYRENYASARFADHLPDIFIQKPDTIRPMAQGAFISTNKHYGFVERLGDVYDDNWTGIKNSEAVCFMSSEVSRRHESRHHDLTDTYNTIIHFFS